MNFISANAVEIEINTDSLLCSPLSCESGAWGYIDVLSPHRVYRQTGKINHLMMTCSVLYYVIFCGLISVLVNIY